MAQIVHGLSIPLGKLGYNLPRTLSNQLSTPVPDPEEPEPFNLSEHLRRRRQRFSHRRHPDCRRGIAEPPRTVFRLGGSVIPAKGIDATLLHGETTSLSQPKVDQESELVSSSANTPSMKQDT